MEFLRGRLAMAGRTDGGDRGPGVQPRFLEAMRAMNSFAFSAK